VTLQPIILSGGYTGWTFLKRTGSSQTALLAAQPEAKRDAQYFRDKIGSINTAEQLVNDRRLLKVALEAFGLEGDLNNKYFIRKVLEDGTLKEGTLSSKLADKQYQKLSAAFGFGDFSVPRSKISDFADKILTARNERAFETAVGTQDNALRLALNARRELADMAGKGGSDSTQWFRIMGNSPLRQVFEKGLGLPTSTGKLNLDRQLGLFRTKAETLFGSSTVAQFKDPAKVETLIRRFLLRTEADAVSAQSSPGAAALQMLTQTNALLRRI
jgi:Protein of unknown function (DUF1217)